MAKKRKTKSSKEVDFNTAFKYPFKNAGRMWNILWILLPIIGWFALGGYLINIVKNFVKGDFSGLPKFDFSGNFKLGFFMFLKAIPFMLDYYIIIGIVGAISLYGLRSMWLYNLVSLLVGLFIMPILTINFFNKETIASYFEFEKLEAVFSNLKDYILVLLKTFGIGLIFLVMIVILVGFPALMFTMYIFYADFYRRYTL